MTTPPVGGTVSWIGYDYEDHDGDNVDGDDDDDDDNDNVRMIKLCPGKTVEAPIFNLCKMFKMLKIFKISNNIVQAKLSELNYSIYLKY